MVAGASYGGSAAGGSRDRSAPHTARERLETHGIEPVTVEEDPEGEWTVLAPADRKDEALEQLQIVEQRRRGAGI